MNENNIHCLGEFIDILPPYSPLWYPGSDNGEYQNYEGLCCPVVTVTEVIAAVAELFTSFPTNMILTLHMKHWLLGGAPTPHYLTLWNKKRLGWQLQLCEWGGWLDKVRMGWKLKLSLAISSITHSYHTEWSMFCSQASSCTAGTWAPPSLSSISCPPSCCCSAHL